jgi:hypothetical protein
MPSRRSGTSPPERCFTTLSKRRPRSVYSPGLAHERQPRAADERVERGTRGLEQRHAGEILGGRRVRAEPVDEPDAVDDPALDEAALVHIGIELERRDRDVAAHRLAVNDRPARRAELLDDVLAQRERVGEKPIRSIPVGTVAGRGPRVAARGELAAERGALHVAASRPFALIAVREHDETAVPLGRETDDEVGVSEPSLAPGRCVGGRRRPGDPRERERHDHAHRGGRRRARHAGSQAAARTSPNSRAILRQDSPASSLT